MMHNQNSGPALLNRVAGDGRLGLWHVQSPREAVGVAVLLIVACILGRLCLEQPNFKPTLAAAVLAGALLSNWRWAIAIPIVSTLVTDVWLGFYQWPLMLTVYACLVAPVFWREFGQRPQWRWLPQPKTAWGRHLGMLVFLNLGAIVSAVGFYLATSLAVWAVTPWYSGDAQGLWQAYLNALPFLRWMLQGNLWFLNLMVCVWAAYRLGAWSLSLRHDAQPALPQ